MKLQLTAIILSATLILSTLSLAPVSYAEKPDRPLQITNGELEINEEDQTAKLSFTASVDGTTQVTINRITFPNILCSVPVITPNGQQVNSMMPCEVEINECISEEEVPIEETFESDMESISPNGKVHVKIDYDAGCSGGTNLGTIRVDGILIFDLTISK